MQLFHEGKQGTSSWGLGDRENYKHHWSEYLQLFLSKVQQPVYTARAVTGTNHKILPWQVRILSTMQQSFHPHCLATFIVAGSVPSAGRNTLHLANHLASNTSTSLPGMGFSYVVLEAPTGGEGSELRGTLEKLLPLGQRPSGASKAVQNLLTHSYFMILTFQEHRMEGLASLPE